MLIKKRWVFWVYSLVIAIVFGIGGLVAGLNWGYDAAQPETTSTKSSNAVSGKATAKPETKKVNSVATSPAAEFKLKTITTEKAKRDTEDPKYDKVSGQTFNKELPKNYYVTVLNMKFKNTSNSDYDLSYGGYTLTDANGKAYDYMGQNPESSFSADGLTSGTLKSKATKSVIIYVLSTKKGGIDTDKLTLSSDGFWDNNTKKVSESSEYIFNN